MFISISGTPGTGKTSTGKILSKRLGAKLIDTNLLIRRYKIKTSLDRKRKTKIIGAEKLSAAAKKESKKYSMLIFEGHLSHLVPNDLTVILRTNPTELEKRLKKKGWSKKKITENMEAELIGLIPSEARKNAVEIDTTGKSPKQTAALIIKLLDSYSLQKRYSARKIDWTNDYIKYLKKK